MKSNYPTFITLTATAVVMTLGLVGCGKTPASQATPTNGTAAVQAPAAAGSQGAPMSSAERRKQRGQ